MASLAELVQNRVVNFYDECLTLGENLGEEERLALYRYLYSSKKREYKTQARALLSQKRFCNFIANGEVEYKVSSNCVEFRTRRLDSLEFTPVVREMKLGLIRPIRIRRLKRFFAQSAVDVIRNFPLASADVDPDVGFGINTFPYYSLRHFSNGGSKMLGLLRKIRTYDSEVLVKLRTL